MMESLTNGLAWLLQLLLWLAPKLFSFVFYYPLVMAWMWIIGGLLFYFRLEFRVKKNQENGDIAPPIMQRTPPCSILIPCYNEEDNVRDTIHYALSSVYPNFEVIAINDGSKDKTAEILDELAAKNPRLRVVHLAQNQGKAIGLRSGAIAASYEYLVCIDGDALLHPYTVAWMMSQLTSGARVGAVTGNPRILNRSSLLGKIQVGEFSSIIGLIKRAQRSYGRIFTVSGAIAAFRKTALHRVGYWNEEMITEDIDISWRLQLDGWDIRYEPDAICYIYMPETLKGLWKQRLRWAQGGVEVLIRHTKDLFKWKNRAFWLIWLEYLTSVIWSYIMLLVLIVYVLGFFMKLPPALNVPSMMPVWHGVILGFTCLSQFLVSLMIDRRYEQGQRMWRTYFWTIWFPVAYWLMSLFTTIVALPKTLLKKKGARARWVSPDRGIRP